MIWGLASPSLFFFFLSPFTGIFFCMGTRRKKRDRNPSSCPAGTAALTWLKASRPRAGSLPGSSRPVPGVVLLPFHSHPVNQVELFPLYR